MATKTKTRIITYNLKDRGRQYRGQERHFDIPAIVRAINSPECQERVKSRDMLGFYGHWPRVRFGMTPSEGGIQGAVAPALVTTYLKAYEDGTIEHQEEFLDTDTGKIAWKMFEGRVGGFSSAIDQRRPAFYGFDYVNEPNYSTNRGYALDGVLSGEYTLDSTNPMTIEQVEAAMRDEQLHGLMALLDSVERQNKMANDTIESLRDEVDELHALLTKQGMKPKEIQAVLDGVPHVDNFSKRQLLAGCEAFNQLKDLPRFAQPKEAPEESNSEAIPGYMRIMRGF